MCPTHLWHFITRCILNISVISEEMEMYQMLFPEMNATTIYKISILIFICIPMEKRIALQAYNHIYEYLTNIVDNYCIHKHIFF